MKSNLFPIALAAFLTFVSTASPSALTLVGTTDLPGISGDLDHLAIDASGNRLFLAAEDNGTLRVIDLKTGKLEKTIKGFNTPHSIVFLPDQNELYIADGSKAVQVLDIETFQVKKTVPTMPGADSVGVDRGNKILYAVSGGKDVSMTHSAISKIDMKAGKLLAEFPIDAAHVEAMALEKTGPRLFVNVTDKNYLAVLDKNSGTVLARWPIKEAKQNAPIAFDEANKRLFVVCRDPGMLVVLDSSNGRTIASFPTGARADEVVFDPMHHHIYVTAGEGKIYPYEESDADHYKALEPVVSAPGAKTAALYPDCSRLYVAVSPGEGKTGAKVLAYSIQ